jgi:hypothetical protein
MRRARIIFIVFTVFLFSLFPVVLADVTIPKRPIFFPFNNGAYLTFSTSILPLTFSGNPQSVYRDTINRWHFGTIWITSTKDVTISAWFSVGWLNYTVGSLGTQQVNNGSKPTSVTLDGAKKGEGDGWSYSGGTVTVIGASASASLHWGVEIAIGQFQAPSTVYANKLFYLNCTVDSPNGNTTFANATLAINGSVSLFWNYSTNAFSEYADTDHYCTFDSGTRVYVNATAFRLCWRIKLAWNYTEGQICAQNTSIVWDNAGNSGTATETSLFTFESCLHVASASFDDGDGHVNPSQSITFTGQLYYEGTSTPPEDATGITGRVELAGTLKGSNTTINSTGHFVITISAETGTASYSYNVYAVTTKNTDLNQTVAVVVDRMKVANYSASNPHADINSNILINATVIYDYNSAAVTTGTFTINGYSVSNLGGGIYQITRTSPTVTSVIYNVVAGSETAYGLNTVNQNSQSIDVIWDQVNVLLIANVTNPSAGEYINCNATATYAYTGNPVGSWTINVFRNSTHFASGNFTDHNVANIAYLYTTENITESAYGLTAFTSNTVTIVWGSLFVEIDQISTVLTRLNITEASMSYYHCRFSSNQSSCASGTLTVNGTGFSINSTGWASVTFTFGTVNVRVLNITAVNVNGVTAYGQVPADPQIIWDEADVYYFVVDDSRVDVAGNVEVRVTARLAYDGHAFGTGDAVSVNGSALSWDAVNSWFEKSFSQASVGNWSFTVTSLGEASYGITNFTQSAVSPSAVWDSLTISMSVADNRINVCENASISVSAVYDYDGTVFDGTLTLNDTSYNLTSVQRSGFTVASASGGSWGITLIRLNDVDFVIWDKLTVSFSASGLNLYQNDLVNVSWAVTRQYDGSVVAGYVLTVTKDGAEWKANTSNSSDLDAESLVASHVYSCYNVTDGLYDLASFDSVPVTVSWVVKGGGGGGGWSPSQGTGAAGGEGGVPSLVPSPGVDLMWVGIIVIGGVVVVASLEGTKKRGLRSSSKSWSRARSRPLKAKFKRTSFQAKRPWRKKQAWED